MNSDDNRFGWVASLLISDVQVEEDVVSSCNYKALGEAVTTPTGLIHEQRIRQLLQGVQLGNRRSSELRWKMELFGRAPFGGNPL